MAPIYEKDVEDALCEWLPGHFDTSKDLIDFSLERQVQLPNGQRADVVSMSIHQWTNGKLQFDLDVWEVKLGGVGASTLNQLGEYWLSLRDWLDGKYGEFEFGSLARGCIPDVCGHLVGAYVDQSFSLSYARANATNGPGLWQYKLAGGVFDFERVDIKWPKNKCDPPTLNKFLTMAQQVVARGGANVEAP